VIKKLIEMQPTAFDDETNLQPLASINTERTNSNQALREGSKLERKIEKKEVFRSQTIDTGQISQTINSSMPKMKMPPTTESFSTKGKAKAMNFIHMHSGLDDKYRKTYYKAGQDFRTSNEMESAYNFPLIKNNNEQQFSDGEGASSIYNLS
jgi:hypothetical protein